MKKLLLILSGASALLVTVILVRTARFASAQAPVAAAPAIAIRAGAAERLAGAIRIPTISHEDPASFDAKAFRALHSYLERSFPKVHSRLAREVVATHSLLYKWTGSDSSLSPIMLIGHMDVVPVEAGTEKAWQQDPFGGRIVDGFIWGRGAIDNKSTVVGTLEAVEMLLESGFHPKRTVYLGFGHDEEVGGRGGAAEVAALLKRRGVELEMVLDEGGVIGDGILPGIAQPIALVGIAEKGFVSVELSTSAAGGHSSLPPTQTTIGILSAAITRLEENPMPARLESPARQLFDRVGPRFPFAQRVAFANLWLTRPLVLRSLEKSRSTNAMIRTTTAVTIFQAGTKDNVLASQARAVINFRILQGDSIAGVLQHVRRVIADQRIDVKPVGAFFAEPSVVSNTDSDAFRTLAFAIRKTAAGVLVAPYQVVVVTDARHYAGVSRNAFRFLPLRLTSRDLQRMHGTDERIAVRDYEVAIRLYRQLIVDAAG